MDGSALYGDGLSEEASESAGGDTFEKARGSWSEAHY